MLRWNRGGQEPTGAAGTSVPKSEQAEEGVPTPENAAQSLRPSRRLPGFGRRAFAWWLDWLTVGGLSLGLLVVITAILPFDPYHLYAYLVYLLGIVYFTFAACRRIGVGPHLLGLYVVRSGPDSAPGLGRSLLRSALQVAATAGFASIGSVGPPAQAAGILPAFVSVAWFLVGLGDYLWALRDPDRRTLHDLLARTTVLDARSLRPRRRKWSLSDIFEIERAAPSSARGGPHVS